MIEKKFSKTYIEGNAYSTFPSDRTYKLLSIGTKFDLHQRQSLNKINGRKSIKKTFNFKAFGWEISIGIDSDYNDGAWRFMGFRHINDYDLFIRTGSLNVGWLWIGWMQ